MYSGRIWFFIFLGVVLGNLLVVVFWILIKNMCVNMCCEGVGVSGILYEDVDKKGFIDVVNFC